MPLLPQRVWRWARSLTSLKLSLLLCKMGIIMVRTDKVPWDKAWGFHQEKGHRLFPDMSPRGDLHQRRKSPELGLMSSQAGNCAGWKFVYGLRGLILKALGVKRPHVKVFLLSLDQFPNRAVFTPVRHLVMSGDIFWLSQLSRGSEGRCSGIQWAEARDSAKHPTVHGTALTTKNYPA